MVVQTPPAPPAPEQDIDAGVVKDARARQRRQRLGGLLLVAAAASGMVLALGFGGGHGGGVDRSSHSRPGRGGATSSGATHAGFSASVTVLPAGGQIMGYQLTTDAHGAGTLVWSTAKFVGTFADSMIRVSEQNSQGKWSTPVQLGGLHQSLNPVLAESRSGAAVIVWSYMQSDPERTVLEAVTRGSANSTWSAPHVIASVKNANGALPSVGIDSAGVATIAWTSYGPSTPAIWTASIDTTNARASKARQLIAHRSGGTDLTLAVNGAGAAFLSWQHQVRIARPKRNLLGTVHAAEMVSYRLASGRWLAPHQLGTFTYPQQPVGMNIWGPTSPPAIIATDGLAALAWLPGMPLEISTRDPATGKWSQTQIADSRGAFNQTVVAGPHDSLRAFWSSSSPRGTRKLRTATSTDGIHWSATRNLSLPRDAFQTFLASDPSGSSALAFTDSRRHVFLTTRAPGSSWTAPQLVGRGFDPVATISTNGSITVAWPNGVAPHTVIETRTSL